MPALRTPRAAALALFSLGLACTTFSKAAAPAAAKPKPEPPSISGSVTGPDGKAVAEAVVLVLKTGEEGALFRRAPAETPVTARTKEDGKFTVTGLKGKTFSLYVVAPKAAPAFLKDVPAGATVSVKLKKGLTLSGSVVDLDTGRPVAGATVLAWSKSGARFGDDGAVRARTDDGGRFAFDALAPGAVTLEAFSPRHAREQLPSVQLETPKADGTTVAPAPLIVLRPGGRIAGRVVDGAGKPVARATVSATPAQFDIGKLGREPQVKPVLTDDAGKFTFDGVPAGIAFRLRATDDKSAAAETEPLSVDAGAERSDVELKLTGGATLVFRLIDGEERPVVSVAVNLEPVDSNRRSRFAGPGAVDEEKIAAIGDGRFEVKRLEPGTFDLTLTPEGFTEIEKEGVKLRTGEPLDLGTLVVKEGKTVSGSVHDTGGKPVAGAEVTAVAFGGAGSFNRMVKTKADGSYRIPTPADQRITRMWVRATGFVEKEGSGANAGDSAVDFTLERAGTIAGKVLRADGSAPPSFQVKTHSEASESNDMMRGMRMVMAAAGPNNDVFTDPAGEFRLDGVAPGTVTVEATSPGKAPARKSGVKVDAEQMIDVGTLTLGDGRTLRGRVLDVKDDSALVGAVVGVSLPRGMGFRMPGAREETAAISGTDGGFVISGLEARTYQVAVQHPNFSPNESKIDVPEDQDPAELVIRLSRGGTLTGTVRDASKQPVAGAMVLAMRGFGGSQPTSATAGADGKYTMEKLAPGDYTVLRTAESGGRARASFAPMQMRQATVKEGEVTVFDLDESGAITLSGRILRGDQPVPNASLTLAPEGTTFEGLKSTQSDAEGRFQIALEKPGAYAAMVRGDGGRSLGRAQIVVPDEPKPTVDVQLPIGSVTGRVVDGDNHPIADASVTANSSAAGGARRSAPRRNYAMTSGDGSFAIEGLEPGSWTLEAAAAGYQCANPPTVVVGDDGSAAPVDIRMEKGGLIRGRVLDTRGNGIAQAVVFAAPAGVTDTRSSPVTSDVNGAFVLTAPGAGPMDVTAVAPGYAPARAGGVTPDDPGGELVLRAGPGATLRVNVTGPDGKPVAGAKVELRANPPFLGSGLMMFQNLVPPTDATGAAVATTLAGGAYDITVRLGERSATVSASVDEGGQAEARLVLP